MTFIDPSIEEVYNILLNNDEIINFLKREKIIITEKELKNNYTEKEANKLLPFVFTENVNTIYRIAEVLVHFKDEIKEKSLMDLLESEEIKESLSNAVGIPYEYLDIDVYKYILYTYKYCYISSFFQNNKKTFLPDNDYFEMQNNSAAMSFYDAMMKEFDKMDSILDKCTSYLDYDKIPWDLINYTTQLLGFEKSLYDFEDKDEKKIRELIKNILDLYRIKGTNYSFELFFNFLGYDIKIKEYYFDRRLFYLKTRDNKETDETNKRNYEFYLTTVNPENNNVDVTINEIVMPSDISEQYSLKEFDELTEKYGPEVVLGYASHYYSGNEWKKYEGKVYKYFKTNLVYYEVSLPGETISADKYKSIAKCLNFFTPSYVRRRATTAKGDIYNYNDTLSFNDLKEIAILDGEDWDEYGKYDIVETKEDGKNYNKSDGSLYQNSLVKSNPSEEREKETNKYRMPIDNRFANVSFNKYFANRTGVDLLDWKRIKFYKGKKGNSVEILPYYTVPPKVENEKNIELFGEKRLDPVNLIGKDSLKENVKNNETAIKIESINSIENNEISSTKLLSPRTLSLIYTAPKGTNIKSLPFRFSYEKPFEKDQLDNYFKYENVCKNLVYGKCVIGEDANYKYIYRYGNYKLPSKDKDGNYNTQDKDYINYVNSFLYKPIKVSQVNDKTLYSISAISLGDESEIEKDMNERRKDSSNPNYVSSLYYYSEKDRFYYKAIKVVNPKSIKDFETSGTFLNKEYINEIGEAYIYQYKDERKAGHIYYNKADGKFYKVNSDNLKYEELKDFFGRIEKGTDGNYYLHQYDECWEGYDEEADSEDFIGYNHNHKVYWPELGFDNDSIGRPIKDLLDKEINENKAKKDALFYEVCNKSFENFLESQKDEILVIANEGITEEKDQYESIEEFLYNYSKNQDNKINSIIKKISEYNKAITDTDEYGRYLNCYIFAKEFAESIRETSNYINFIKDYYYRKLVSLYRYRFLDDNGKVDLNILEKKPMFVYPKVINSLMATCNNNLTTQTMLQTSYKNNGLNKEPVKIIFEEVSSLNNKSLRFKVPRSEFIKNLGFDINPELIAELGKLNIEHYLEDFGYNIEFIKPIFFYKDKVSNNIVIRKLSKLYKDCSYYFVDTNYIIIEIKNAGIYIPNNIEFKNLYGYLEVKNFSQTLLDTVVSVPESYRDYLEKDIYDRVNQLISFGDDRELNYSLKYNNGIECSSFINEEGKIIIKVPKAKSKINSDVRSISLLTLQSNKLNIKGETIENT